MPERGMIVDMDFVDVMKNVTRFLDLLGIYHAEPEAWFEIAYQKTADDESFWELVDGFLDGEWQDMPPIQLSTPDGGKSWQVHNGHHRIVAAWLTASPKIRVEMHWGEPALGALFSAEGAMKLERSGMYSPDPDDTLASALWSSNNWGEYIGA